MNLLFILACTGLALATGAQAQTYPSKPIRLVVQFVAGGGPPGMPDQFGVHLKREFDKWAKVIKTIGLKTEAGS